jgi:hypothetical protein
MSKVKVKQVKKMVGDVNINGMFEEMMGVKDADPAIIAPKFVKLRNTLKHICKIFMQFSSFTPLRNDFPECKKGLDEIKDFVEKVKESTYITDEPGKTDSDKDTADSKLTDNDEKYYSLDKKTINELYKKLKDNEYVKRLIIMCNKLEKYKKNFGDDVKKVAPKENFVNQEPGLTFIIFDFSSLDLKLLWANSKITSMVKKYVISILANLRKYSYELYNIITSPDVDVDEFSQILLSSISELKKQPDLHRCSAAFSRIEQSVGLLKEKFPDYYRESVASQNPDALITSFIVDVSNQGGANARLTREFRHIIQYMHKVSNQSGKNKDPAVQKIFSMLNKNFSLMEKQTGVDDSDKSDGQFDGKSDGKSGSQLDGKSDGTKDTVKSESSAKKSKKKKKSKAKAELPDVNLLNIIQPAELVDDSSKDLSVSNDITSSLSNLSISSVDSSVDSSVNSSSSLSESSALL